MRFFVTEQEVRRMVAESLTRRFGVKVRHFNLEASTAPGPEGDQIFDGFMTEGLGLFGEAPKASPKLETPTPIKPPPAPAPKWPGNRTEPMTIAGDNYTVRLIDGGERALVFKHASGEVYEIAFTADPDKALAKGGDLHGYQCECGDFVHRHAGPNGDGKPCKHLRRLDTIGLLPRGAEGDDPSVGERVMERLGWETHQSDVRMPV